MGGGSVQEAWGQARGPESKQTSACSRNQAVGPKRRGPRGHGAQICKVSAASAQRQQWRRVGEGGQLDARRAGARPPNGFPKRLLAD